MAKYVIAFLLCISFVFPGSAQTLREDSFGVMPDSLFSSAQYPSDPEVPFIYSLKKVDVSFDEADNAIIAVLKYHVRVKIFDSSVKEAAVVGIPYYFANDIEQVSDIRGYTWQSPNRKIPLSSSDIRTININSRYNVKEFTMPAVTDGSVIEYAYTVRRRYLEELPDFYLANQVPTERAEISIIYPKYLRYDGIVQNYDGNLDHFTSRIDTSTVPKVFSYPQPEPIVKETWRALNVPAIQKETYISTLDDYRGKIKFQLSAFGIPRQSLENSWDYVVAELRRKQHITRLIDTNKKAKQLGRKIATNFNNKKAAQDSIFSYLNQKVNYSGSKAPFSDTNEKSVLSGQPVDQAAINQTLIAMLRGAGIQAAPVLISSRESGQINRNFPSFFQFNGQLAHSQINGKSYFMDASYSYSKPNLIPVDTYNQTGLLLRGNSYRWVDVNPAASTFSIDVTINATLDRRGNLSGTLQAQNAGYPAREIRRQYAEGASINQIVKDALLGAYSDASVTGAQMQMAGDDEHPTGLKANFSIENYATSYRDGLDFRPMVVGYLQDNPFDEDKRDLPVTLDAPEHFDLSFNIALPNGISMKKNPQNQTFRIPGATFREVYNGKDNTLRYEFHIDISQKQFSPDQFPRLLHLYKRWVQLSTGTWHLSR